MITIILILLVIQMLAIMLKRTLVGKLIISIYKMTKTIFKTLVKVLKINYKLMCKINKVIKSEIEKTNTVRKNNVKKEITQEDLQVVNGNGNSNVIQFKPRQEK